MESVESYHAERIHRPLLLGTYEELRYKHRLVDVAALSFTRDSPFHPDFRLLWIEGHDLLQDEPIWLPHELVHTDFTLPLPAGSGCFIKSSNGLASGNHVLEAISHGICEVVERDSLSLWHLHSQETRNQTRLDLDTVDDPDCRDLLAKFEQAKIAAAAWEVTSDVRLPVFMCVIKERADNPLRLLYASSGSGCHPDRTIALLRALTEAAQSRLTHISGARDDNFRSDYERGRSLDLLRSVQAEIETRGRMLRFQGSRPVKWCKSTSSC